MIQTILGPIEEEQVQYILPHEHILCDLRFLVSPLDNGIFHGKVSLENFGDLSRNPYAVLDNAALDDRDVAVREIARLPKVGFNLVADATTENFGRDKDTILFLRELSQKTGVHLVLGCGSYHDATVSPEFKAKPVSEMRDIILRELNEGIYGTDIRAGMIGEIGISRQITPAEYKFLQAAALAQAETGCGMHIHACLWNREGLKALDYVIQCGASPEKVSIDHSDVVLDEEYMFGIVERGGMVEFDNFGKEYYVDRKNRNHLEGSFAHDTDRVRMMKKLIDRGYLHQILVTNDVCLKTMLHAYGGWGYDHIGENIIPMMEDFGITSSQIDTILRENPLRFLERNP